MKAPRGLSVPEQHQLRIARDTLKMNDVFARIMGGPTKEEARQIIIRLTGKDPGKVVNHDEGTTGVGHSDGNDGCDLRSRRGGGHLADRLSKVGRPNLTRGGES